MESLIVSDLVVEYISTGYTVRPIDHLDLVAEPGELVVVRKDARGVPPGAALVCDFAAAGGFGRIHDVALVSAAVGVGLLAVLAAAGENETHRSGKERKGKLQCAWVHAGCGLQTGSQLQRPTC